MIFTMRIIVDFETMSSVKLLSISVLHIIDDQQIISMISYLDNYNKFYKHIYQNKWLKSSLQTYAFFSSEDVFLSLEFINYCSTYISIGVCTKII